MNKIGVFGAKKVRKSLAGNELGKNLFKEEVWGDILSVQDNFLLENGFPVDKTRKIF